MKYLDPKNDLTFKKIFGQHKHLCISLLNSLLPLEEGKEIVSIDYLSPEMVPEIASLKNSIVDVRCTDKQGRNFIVEMQMDWTKDFKQRVLFNASKAYIGQLKKGVDYELLQPVYVLSLVYENFEKDMDSYYHYYRMVHTQNSSKVIEGLELVFVELKKFKAKNISDKKMQVLWLMFLVESERDKKDIPQILLDNEYTKEALEYLEESSYTEDELLLYNKFLDIMRTDRMRISNSFGQGKIEGEQIGLQKGKAEGEQIGLQKGKAEGKAEGKIEGKIETAKQLRALGVSIEIISQATGLSKNEIEQL